MAPFNFPLSYPVLRPRGAGFHLPGGTAKWRAGYDSFSWRAAFRLAAHAFLNSCPKSAREGRGILNFRSYSALFGVNVAARARHLHRRRIGILTAASAGLEVLTHGK